ncbi:unnamed protein product [Prunus armeniaca]
MGTTTKRKRSDTPPVSSQVTPKRRSMRILHARSTGTRTSNVEAAGTPVDDDSDDGDTTESEADVQNKRTLMTLATCVKILTGTTMMIAMRMHLLIPATIEEDKVVQMLSLGPLVAGSNLAAAIADPARSPPQAEHAASNL